MSLILCIDTATDTCSVVLSDDNKIVSYRESADDRSHAVKLAVFIDEVLHESGIKAGQLSAVAVSMGPGSYTGLRIGISTAKGLCYGAGIPLIAVSTLQSMCFGVSRDYLEKNRLTDFYFCPMLDARRMEVYTALFNPHCTNVKDISAEIIDSNSYKEFLETKPVIFFGSGAEKVKTEIKHTNAFFYEGFVHSAKNIITLASEKLNSSKFEDVAYFEPFYLKDFIATVPRKNILS